MVTLNVQGVTTNLSAVKDYLRMSSKIGIFSGTFDPVHSGHIKFALEALTRAGLDKVYFLPEARPRRKESVTHFAHRVAMLEIALKPYRNLEVLEIPDKQFSTTKTLSRLRQRLGSSELYYLTGTDTLTMLASTDASKQWPGFEQFLSTVSLVVGVRVGTKYSHAKELLEFLGAKGMVIRTTSPHVSSSDIRRSVEQGRDHEDLLDSLKPYVDVNWLYASMPSNNS